MDARVLLQPGYVLHSRPFRNTSLLLDFLTCDYGRVTAVARGARRGKSGYRPLLQPFQPLLISFSGRGEVRTVTGVEISMTAIAPRGERLFSGFYLNELLMRLLHGHEEHRALYQAYQDTIVGLQGKTDLQLLLRKFEMSLLAELGYGIDLEQEHRTREPIASGSVYRFTPDLGFEAVNTGQQENAGDVFEGRHLLALRALDLQEAAAAKSARRLLRLALAARLGDKPLRSRALFASQE